MRIAIIGAGVFGLASALELARRGHRVELFEADAIPAERAASNDVSKALRRTYGPMTKRYGPLAVQARDAWRALERATGTTIYRETGYVGLSTHLAPGSFEQDSLDALARSADPPRRVDVAIAATLLPNFDLTGVDGAIHDVIAGWLDPIAALEALAHRARAHGATLHTHTRIASVEALDADAVVIAAGAWVARLAPALRMNVTPSLQVELLFRARAGANAPRQWPFWSFDLATKGFYGFPESPEGLFKVACHRPGRTVDPDGSREAPPEDVETIATFVSERIPFLERHPTQVRTCLYTMSEDGDFVFDRIEGPRPIVVAGCGSGHAFKFGPKLGEFAADAIEGKPVPAEFRVPRQGGRRTV
ncbi:MAG: FAD-dependent oxidoreductase [Planctomycetes bacterium]|nr:FAD-dependent oxidoreductase [Planctomycetota bacterium]MCC7170379.1 FAD-dependent oxidoreductase [Planctomycetota bacterium]